MSDSRVRRQIAAFAAQLMYARDCSEYFTAKRKAARQVLGGDGSFRDLPSNREIREEILLLADLVEGDRRRADLAAMRLEALRFLRLLSRHKPRLIGSVLTGHVRRGSDIDIHVFSDSVSAVSQAVEDAGYACEVERKRVLKHGEERVFNHAHVHGRFNVELTIYAADKANYPFRSSITGKTIERAGAAELEALIRRESEGIDIEAELGRVDEPEDAWEVYASLLRPLESVKQNPAFHPEGDALYHSLQVFDRAREVRAYDQEFLLAALLHDVGKGIDSRDHVAAGVGALQGLVSERTLWFIEHHMEAHQCRDGSIGARAKRRLSESEDNEDLLLLSECDQAGRVRGAITPTIDEALEFIRDLEFEHGA